MKTVITTVGTSLISNSEKQGCDFSPHLAFLDDPLSQSDDITKEIVKSMLTRWLQTSNKLSAEIFSLRKIQEEFNDKLNVILITSDTHGSNICAEVIRDFFKPDDGIKIKEIKNIENLRVNDYEEYQKGRINLIRYLRSIVKCEFSKPNVRAKKVFDKLESDYIINFSGGYKGVITTLTLFAQLYSIGMYYLFEGTDQLIRNENIPIGFDEFYLEKLFISLDMKKRNSQYQEKDDHVKKLLRRYGFIDTNGKVTEFGELFYDYCRYKRDVSRNVLGFYVEYKLYEYFLNIRGIENDNIKHSYHIDKHEIDFLLYDNIIVEVKSLIRFNFSAGAADVRNQILNPLMKYKKCKEHHLYLYTSYKDALKINDNLQKNMISEYKQLKKQFPQVCFKVFEVYWPFHSKDDNQYQTFMKNQFKAKDVTEYAIDIENESIKKKII
ncbi:MAG: hypothetical protein JXB49_08905 [Bacteroidales bacterium]|nr:hypothetical protein [Bacteroidales bacterium]